MGEVGVLVMVEVRFDGHFDMVLHLLCVLSVRVRLGHQENENRS